MTAAEYLEQINRLDRQIRCKKAILASLKDRLQRATGLTDGEVVVHSRNVHAGQDIIAKSMDMRNEIAEDEKLLSNLQNEALCAIRQLDDITCQAALILHYVWLNPWKEVADALFYNERSIYKVRDKAIEKLDELIMSGQIELGSRGQ